MARLHRIAAALFAAALCAACSDETTEVDAPRSAPAESRNAAPIAVRPRNRPDAADAATAAAADEQGTATPGEDETAKPPLKPLTVRVVTRGADGANVPVAGATVVAEDDACVRHEATTDDDGVARFEPPIEGGYARIDATAPGMTRGHAFADPDAMAAGTQISVSLEAGRTLEGVVLDAATGLGVAGAHVTVFTLADGNPSRTYAEAVTAADGTFRCDGMPSSQCTVRADEPHHVTVKVRTERPQRGRIEIGMEPAGALRGVVRDPNGAPVRGANVVASPAPLPVADTAGVQPEDAPVLRPATPSEASALTGADGSYEIGSLALTCAWTVTAAADGFCVSETSSPLTFGVAPREAVFDLALRRPPTLDVRVTRPDGAAAVGARVMLTQSDAVAVSGATDALGACTLAPRGARITLLRVELAPFPVVYREVQVVPGERTLAEIALGAGAAVAGVVLDDRGEPVAGAAVSLSRSNPWDSRVATTAQDGGFRIERLGSGAATLSCSHDAGGFTAARVQVSVPDENVRLVLKRRGTVTFRLIPPKGVTPERIVWMTQPDTTVTGTEWSGDVQRISRDAGHTKLTLIVPGFVHVVREVDVAPGEEVALGDIPLERDQTK